MFIYLYYLFFFNDTATTEIYTLSLHDALPISRGADFEFVDEIFGGAIPRGFIPAVEKGIQDARAKGYLAGFPMVEDRKSTRLNSSHANISYAVFCLKKKT